MQNSMDKDTKAPQGSMLVFVCAGVIAILCYFVFNAYIENIVLIAMVNFAALMSGIVFSFLLLMCVIHKDGNVKRNILGLAITILFLVVGWLTPLGNYLGIYSRLLLDESSYMVQVNRAIASQGKADMASPAIVDEGPPVRVAFCWGGLLDNWSGVVYDPTGEVLKVNGNPNAEARDLFGGHMLQAKHLWGYWYWCAFT